MKIETHLISHLKIAEIITDQIILSTPEEGLDLLGNLYYQGFDGIIIHGQNITPAFFDLKTTIAGEILQKFAQYRMPLIIIGDFLHSAARAYMISYTKAIQAGRSTSFPPDRKPYKPFRGYEGEEFELITCH